MQRVRPATAAVSSVSMDVLAAAVARQLGLLREPARALPGLEMRGIKQRGSTWIVETHVRNLRVKQGGFATREQARDWLALVRSSHDVLLDHVNGRSRAVATEIVDRYLEQRGGLRSLDRYEQYRAHLARLIGPQRASDIRQRHADEYVERRISEGASRKTAWNELSLLRAALRYAWRNDWVPQQPRFALSKPVSVRERVCWPDEARRLMEAAPLTLQRFALACYTRGMRRDEARLLRWEHVRVATREAVIPAEISKTGRPKAVWLGGWLWELLQQRQHAEWVFSAERQGRNGRGKVELVQWSETALRRAWDAACAAAGIEGLTVHDLRRSFASVAASQGAAEHVIRAVGGWQAGSDALRRHYSHASQDDCQRLVLHLEGLLRGEGAGLLQRDDEPESVTLDELQQVLDVLRSRKGRVLQVVK